MCYGLSETDFKILSLTPTATESGAACVITIWRILVSSANNSSGADGVARGFNGPDGLCMNDMFEMCLVVCLTFQSSGCDVASGFLWIVVDVLG